LLTTQRRRIRSSIVAEVERLAADAAAELSSSLTWRPSGKFRPTIALGGAATRVLVEQTTVVDPQRLGRTAGRLDADELQRIVDALALVLGL
jgi:mRNA interferase MazF